MIANASSACDCDIILCSPTMRNVAAHICIWSETLFFNIQFSYGHTPCIREIASSFNPATCFGGHQFGCWEAMMAAALGPLPLLLLVFAASRDGRG